MATDMEWLRSARSALRPPPLLPLSDWADEHYHLSAESAAEPGRWKTLPYQRGMMDAITDPAVEHVSVMKSARIGYTKMIGAVIGYHMHHDPCPIMVVQPTVEDAEGYSKEEIAPMLRDCPVLADLVGEQRAKASTSTILAKSFPGGSLTMVGANSGRGFRRVSRRVVIFDEVDGYPPSAGSDGDQIKLGTKRTEWYWNRKIIAGSTPLVAGASRIEELFEAGDQRRYHVPCPHCGHMDYLVFSQGEDERGHYMQWPEGEPENAYFVCSESGCIIEQEHKYEMLEGGEWVADAPFSGHASFHIWAAYSMSPNASWGHIASEFIEANEGGTEKLKTFVNTALGETWKEKGDAPAWERIYNRRESYQIGTVPDGVVMLTCGVDVQKDRFVFEVVGWCSDRSSFSVDSGLLMGNTSSPETWNQLDELLDQAYLAESGGEIGIAMMAIDSGYNTQEVYSWAQTKPLNRVMAIKGVDTARSLISPPSPVEIKQNGRRRQRGYKVWPLGVSIAKAEFYGWLRLEPYEDGSFPPGYCHFPEYDEAFFLQITAEQLVTVRKRGGFAHQEWQMIPGRENHWLDTRVYARAAAMVKGLDRMRGKPNRPPASRGAAPSQPVKSTQSAVVSAKKKQKKQKPNWFNGGRSGSFMSRRRS